MLSTSFPRKLWFFLQVVTIIGITSNLSSNSKEPFKYPKVFMTDPSNWWSSNLLFRKVGFPMHSLKFLGISITSLPKLKLLILTFSKMSFFFCSIFYTFFFLFFTERLFFLNLHTAWKRFFFFFFFFFKAICTSVLKCCAFSSFYFMFTIQNFLIFFNM